MSFIITSSAFYNKNRIPLRYTCDGENISPPLKWEDSHKNAKSFVLILDDPDAPAGIWSHWIVYNIPNSTSELIENIKTLPSPAKLGQNSWGKENYRGPCPPSGEHRYFFKLYALNQLIASKEKITRASIKHLIEPYVVGEAILIGTYSKTILL